MTRPHIPTINWKHELSMLDRFFYRDGGVIHIRTTPESPSSAFSKAIRNKMENEISEVSWLTIQFEGNNSSTHYLTDMINQMCISLAIPFDTCDNSVFTATVASNIKARGDVTIQDVHMHLPPEKTPSIHLKAKEIISFLSRTKNEKRTALIFFDSDNADPCELAAFRTILWNNGLEDLVQDGLLLIVFIDQSTSTPHWLPEADEIIHLPAVFDDHSARNAIEDLTSYAVSQQLFKSAEEAKAFAITLVSNNQMPKHLYANFAAMLLTLERLS